MTLNFDIIAFQRNLGYFPCGIYQFVMLTFERSGTEDIIFVIFFSLTDEPELTVSVLKEHQAHVKELYDDMLDHFWRCTKFI